MHPRLQQSRKAQDRALHLLDTVYGAWQGTTPTPDDHTDRERLEVAYREGARTLLNQDTRVWLKWVEDNNVLTAYGTTPVTDEPPRPARLDELHELVTHANRLQHHTE